MHQGQHLFLCVVTQANDCRSFFTQIKSVSANVFRKKVVYVQQKLLHPKFSRFDTIQSRYRQTTDDIL